MSEAIDKTLGQYVRDEELHGKVDAVHKIVTTLATDRLADKNRLDRYGRKIRQLEGVVYHGAAMPAHASIGAWQPRPPAPSKPEWDPDDTANNQIVDLQKALEEQKHVLAEEERRRRESGLWWKRQRWTWAMAAVGAVLLVLFTSLVTLTIARASVPVPILERK